MTPERNLDTLIARMAPVLDPTPYLFVAIADDAAIDWAALAPVAMVREAGTLSLIVAREAAAGLTGTFPCRRITLTVNSALDAVGFIAAVAGALAKAGISTNPVAGFHHDHLFVPEAESARALEVLQRLAATARG
ncbi:MAG: ACT domain-containing protein [Rhodospirillaceae bacterium]|nr:ACT domain-containing protein [Rhodospirillaceae bacterium]MCA8934034.1 ACT domain-containing protein [Rhodospirillaceae bacterium]